MAFFNPKQVSFNPNSQVIKDAGAIGSYMQDYSRNQFKENLQLQENERLQEQFGFNQKKFDFEQTKYNNGLAQIQSDAQNNLLQAQGKATAMQQYQPELYNNLSTQFGNNPNALAYAVDGASSYSPPSAANTKGVFKQDPQGNLNYIQSDGNVTNLGFQVKPDDPRVTNTLTEYQAYADSLTKNGLQAPSFAEFYDKKQNVKTFGTGLRDYDEMQGRLNTIATQSGLQPFDLTSVDVKTLPLKEQYSLGQAVGAIEQSQKDIMPDWAKKEVVNLSQIVHSSSQIGELIQKGDSGLLDNAFNQVNKYLGLGDDAELVRKSMLQSSYALYRNYMLKILSGTSVSASEGQRFTQGFGDLWHTDKATAGKAYQNMSSLKARLETLKDAYNPVVFNYRFGGILKNVDTAMEKMGQSIGLSQPTQQTPIKTQVSTKQEVIAELKSRGANQQQIDNYLQMKGF